MSRETSLPPSVLQPQRPWHAPSLLGPHFSYLNYLLPSQKAARAGQRAFWSNEDVWRTALGNGLRAGMVLRLEGFRLFEWFPRAPGLFHTAKARAARELALRFISDKLSTAPVNAGRRAKPRAARGPHTLVLSPEGKFSMLEGGVGCVRLKPIQREGGVYWLMSASSTGVAHEGFPVAVPQELYGKVIDEIIKKGSAARGVVGELKFFPREFGGLFGSFRGAPQLYLEVHELADAPAAARRGARPATEVSVAVSFASSYRGEEDVYATFVTFDPGRADSFEESVDWMQNEYVEGAYRGRILTDFDQTTVHFPEAQLALRKVMARQLREGEVAEVVELMHARGEVGRLLDRPGKKRSWSGGVARTKVFISYSRRDAKWLDPVQTWLRPLARGGGIEVWDDRRIQPGEPWEEELENAIESAKVAVLLVSANFYASDFINDKELPRLLRAAEAGELTICPLLVGHSHFEDDPTLGRFQSVNDPKNPLVKLRGASREEVFKKLSTYVREALG